jgi:hypothetical protein
MERTLENYCITRCLRLEGIFKTSAIWPSMPLDGSSIWCLQDYGWFRCDARSIVTHLSYLDGTGLSSRSGVPGTELADLIDVPETGLLLVTKAAWAAACAACASGLSGSERELRYGLRPSGAGEEPRERDSAIVLLGWHFSAEPITWDTHASIWFFKSYQDVQHR